MDMNFSRSDWSADDISAFEPVETSKRQYPSMTPAPARALPPVPVPETRIRFAPRFGEAACADVPVAIGGMIVAAYAGILLAFGVVFIGSLDVLFMVGVCAVYLAVYLGVPIALLRMERPGRHLEQRSWGGFVATGLSTWTGQTSAVATLAQILTIPLSMILAVCGIGVMLKLAA